MSFWLPCSFKWTKVCPLYQILFLLNQRECCYFILKYGKKSDPRVLFIVKNCTMDKLHGKKILISSALHFTVFTYNFIPFSTEMYCIFYLNVKTCCKNVPSRLSHKVCVTSLICIYMTTRRPYSYVLIFWSATCYDSFHIKISPIIYRTRPFMTFMVSSVKISTWT